MHNSTDISCPGCDTVSAFVAKRQKNSLEYMESISLAFEHLLLMEDNLSESVISVLERFVVLLYNRTSDLELLNDARKWLFTQKSRTLDNISPTQEALRDST